MINRINVALGCILIAFGACAEPVTWMSGGTSAEGRYWANTNNWLTMEIKPPVAAPTNGEDIAFSPASTNVGGVTVSTGPTTGAVTAYPMVNPRIGVITGGDRYTVEVGGTNGQMAVKRFIEGDFSGFKGYWRAGDARSHWIFSTVPFSQTLSTLYAANRPELVVQSGTVKVDDFMGRGMVVKHGQGRLQVGVTAGNDTSFTIDDGIVEFVGGAESVDYEALVGKAALHLDASDSASMITEKSGGRDSVTEWRDVRNNGYVATVPSAELDAPDTTRKCIAPYIGEKSATGLNLVSFGTAGNHYWAHEPCPDGTYTQFGPTNCYLALNRAVSNVIEVVYCVRQSCPGDGAYATLMDNEERGNDEHYFMADGMTLADKFWADEGGYEINRMRNGEIRVNGLRYAWENLESELNLKNSTNLYVMGLAPKARNTSIWCFGGLWSRHPKYGGGVRIAEVIAFTNKLTTAERRALDFHLRSKWITGERLDMVAENIVFSNQTAKIAVADGVTARVHSAYVPSKKIEKTGPGTFAIENLYPDDAEVDVKDGVIAFGSTTEAVPPVAPASDGPSLWLDADDMYSLETFTSADYPDRTFVSTWKDKRQDTHNGKASSFWEEADITADFAAAPTIYEEGTHRWIDFGNLWTAAKKELSFMNIANVAKSYAGFVVVRVRTVSNRIAPFGCSGMDFTDLYTGSVVGSRYVPLAGVNATWTMNGMPRDPLMPNDPELYQDERAFVMAFSGKTAMTVDRVAAVRSGRSDGEYPKNIAQTDFYGGRIRVGEMILFDRPISVEERTRVEAYLMMKWLGKSHPATTKETVIKSIDFAPTIPQTIAIEGDARIGAITGGNGTFVKKGAGSLQLNQISAGFKAVKVDGGKLTLDYTLPETPAFRFDAMNTGSMQLQRDWVPASPAGPDDETPRTNVVKWTSSSSAEVYAEAQSVINSDPTRFTRMPTLRDIEVKPGVIRPMVDFGYINGSWSGAIAGDYGVNDGTGMYMNRSFVGETGIAEIHTIFADSMPMSKSTYFRGSVASDRSWVRWYRGDGYGNGGSPQGTLFSMDKNLTGYPPADIRNGVVMTNLTSLTMEEITNTVYTGVNLVSLIPLSKQRVDTLAYQSSGVIAGGIRIGEQIAFSTKLSERSREYLLKGLMHKWFGDPFDVSDNIESIEVADGAELELTGEFLPAIRIGLLAGAGTITGNFTGLNEIRSYCKPDGTWGHTAVHGTVEFEDSVTVTLDAGPNDKAVKGGYPIFSADELINVDTLNWTINRSGDETKVLTISQTGNTIYVRVSPKISVIVVR